MKNHQPPLKKGQVIELRVDRLGVSGEGVGRFEGFTVFVPYALPGERVKAGVTDVKKTYATAKIEELLTASADRVKPACAIYDKCGGCQLQHLSYAAQLKAKRQQVIDALTHIGKLPDLFVEETIGAKDPWNYRNKMQFPVGREKGRTVIGCFAQGSHDIIDTKNCLIQREGNNEIVNAVREVVTKLNISVYDEDKHRGVLRHVVGRVGEHGEQMVCLVTATPNLPHEKDVIRMIRRSLPHVVSIQQNIQTYRNNVIMGRETKLLWGSPTITDRLGNLSFHISPRSFFQVNTHQAETLYNKALEFAGLTGRETVIDAYCGTGTITLFLAQKARKVYGIEIVKPAILDAQKNARDNHVKNAEFIVGDATAVMPRLYKQGIRPDVVVVDPPRAGCTPVVLETFADMEPDRIVYVSCNPASLARDLAILKTLGYEAQKVQPVDMFPMTSHVETVVLLSKGEIDSKKVRVEFSLEDMDMSDFQDKATYTQIKDYVLEHSGLKVSNLYISQIKRKCGLEVGKNYNLPKAEDSRQPQCPPEKENAIREAMKYFGMI